MMQTDDVQIIPSESSCYVPCTSHRNEEQRNRHSTPCQKQLFLESPNDDTPHRIAARCTEEDRIEMESRVDETPFVFDVKHLQDEITALRKEVSEYKQHLRSEKRKHEETIRERDELQNILCTQHQLSQKKSQSFYIGNDSEKEDVEILKAELEQALHEISTLSSRLRLAKNISVSTKIELDRARLEIQRLKDDPSSARKSERPIWSSFRTPLKLAAAKRNSTSCQKDSISRDQSKLEVDLRAFYTRHNPSKMSEVKKLLCKYDGRHQEMIEKLEKKYNCTFISTSCAE